MSIKPGDRIITVMHEINGVSDASGIVGMAHAMGDEYMTLLVYGGHRLIRGKMTPVFDVELGHGLVIDVVETGCPCPQIPHVFVEAFSRGITKAEAEFQRKHKAMSDAHERRVSTAAASLNICAMFDQIGDDEIRSMATRLEGASDDDILGALESMVTGAVRGLPGPIDESKATFYAGAIRNTPTILAKIRSAAPKGAA